MDWESSQEGMEKSTLDGRRKQAILKRPQLGALVYWVTFGTQAVFLTFYPFLL